MRINELLLEFEMPNSLRDTPIVTVGDQSLTAGQVADAIPGVDPKDVIEYGSDIKDFLQSKITGDYTVSDALIDVATFYPALRIGKMAMAARGGAGAVSKEIAKGGARNIAGKEIQKRVDVLPTVLPGLKKGGASPEPVATAIDPLTKKRKYKVGDKVQVTVSGKQTVGTVKSVLPQGYQVAVDNKSIDIPEPLSETATAGATSAGSIASTGNSPHVAVGTPAVLKRWSGKPGSSGTSGKSVKHKAPKAQSAKDNPVTNPSVGNNLIA